MIESTRPAVPPDHPVRAVLHQLTDRAMKQLDLRDEETICYVANLLIDFIHCENLYRLRDDSGRRLDTAPTSWSRRAMRCPRNSVGNATAISETRRINLGGSLNNSRPAGVP